MDVTTLVTLHDQQARNEVDARLYFTKGRGGQVETTRTVVYATDPLKTIAYPFESIMTVPTDPPSRRVQLIGGFFYANGKLYPFPGMETDEIIIDLNQDTYVLTGVKIDPKTDRTDLYVQTTYGEYPFMDRDVVPSALIKIPSGFDTILSGYITDLRPFIHYNVSTPEDRAVLDLACINPNESVAFELMRNRRLPPIINFYKKLPPEGTPVITHSFKSEDDVILLGDDPVEVDETFGAYLPQQITANPIRMPNTSNVLFVSAYNGNDFGDGTVEFPLLTLQAAIDKYNGMAQYDTIYLLEGIYTVNMQKQFNRDTVIVGEAATKVTIRFQDNSQRLLLCTDPNVAVTFRTIQFLSITPVQSSTTDASMYFDGNVSFYNCIFKQGTSSQVIPFIKYDSQLAIINCIIHNPYGLAMASRSDLYLMNNSTSGPLFVLNNYIIGSWLTIFTLGVVTRNHQDYGDGSSLFLENLQTYYPTSISPGNGSGYPFGLTTSENQDSTPLSVGLYGGAVAALFRSMAYPIDKMPIFKYAYHTLYSPVIARFVEVTPLIFLGIPSHQCKVYGAVSFNGGHDWLVWDQMLGAWKRIADLNTLDVNGNTADELAMRLVNNGPITTKGEICFAWALKSGNPKYTPYIRGVYMRVKADADTIVPIAPEDLEVWIAGDTVLVTNKSTEKINDVVVVAY